MRTDNRRFKREGLKSLELYKCLACGKVFNKEEAVESWSSEYYGAKSWPSWSSPCCGAQFTDEVEES